MASGYETIMVEVLTRMKAAPALAKSGSIRRAHRTPVRREDAPAVHILDGGDEPTDKCERKCDFTVSIFARSDEGASAAEPLKIEVMRRLSPDFAPWPDGVVVKPGRITHETEVADADATRVDLEFTARYAAAEWSLG